MPPLPRISDAFTPVSIDDWRADVALELGETPIEALSFGTLDGLALEPLYASAPAPMSGAPSHAVLFGAPLSAPLPCPELGAIDLVAANACLNEDVSRGARATFVRLGTDHGVRVVTAGDLAALFTGVDLTKLFVMFEARQDTMAVIASLIGVAETQGAPLTELSGCFGMDPVGTLCRGGSLPAGLRATMVHLADLATWADQDLPRVRSAMVDASVYHDAGATIVQELAWALGTGLEYVRRLVDAGLSIDRAAAQIAFGFSVDGRTFMQAAKLRAARILWAKLMMAMGAKSAARAMHIHARSSSRQRAQRSQETNIVRSTAETLAAVLGSANTVATLPYDHLSGPESPTGRRVALNVAHILHHESHADFVRDPGSGSYLIEHLTDTFVRAAYEQVREIDRDGGLLQVLLSGRISRKLAEVRARRREALATGQTHVVGVTDYPDAEEGPLETPPDERETMRPLFGRLLTDDEDTAVRVQAVTVFVAAASSPNTALGARIRSAIQAAAAGADFLTIRESLCFGRPSFHMDPLPEFRAAAPYEALRKRSDRWLKRRRRRPSAVMIGFGSDKNHRAELDHAESSMAAGAFTVHFGGAASNVEQVGEAFEDAEADVAVLALSEKMLESHGVALVRALRDSGARLVVIAAAPPADVSALRESGVDQFLYRGANTLSIMTGLYDALEGV